MPDQTAKRRARRTTRPSEKPFAEWAWVTLLLVLLAGVIGWQNGLNHLELMLFDSVLALDGRAADPNLVLISVDDANTARLGTWPLAAELQSQFFAKVNAAHPRAIGVLSPLENSNGNLAPSAANSSVAALLQANGHVALNSGPFDAQNDRLARTTSTALLSVAASIGSDQQLTDDDGVVRRAALTADPRTDQNAVPHFVTAVLDAAGLNLVLPGRRSAEVDGGPSGKGDHWVLIPYGGQAGQYPTLSYADVINGVVQPAALAGKIVLVGRSAATANLRRTPIGLFNNSGKAMMAPLEIDAQLLAGLLQQRAITPMTSMGNALACIGPVLAAMLAALFRSRRALPLTIFLAVLTLLAAVLLVPLGNIWFAPGGALASLALALPLWRWRQLEIDARRADAILARIEAAPDHYAEATLAAPEEELGHVERRFEILSRAVYRVSELRFFIDHVIDALPQSLLITNSDGHVVAANRQARNYFASLGNTRLDGAQLPYLLGLMTLEGSAEGRSWWDIMDLSVANPQARAHDVRGRDMLVRAYAWHGINGDLGGWIASVDDVSAARTLERRRNEALQFMGETLSASYRTVLGLIDTDDDEPIDAATRDAIGATSIEALTLTDKFVELSKAESRDYAFAVCDLSDAIELAIDGAYSAAGELGVTIVFDKSATAARAEIDMVMLSRSISVLLTNAVRFSSAGQQIEIDVLDLRSEVVVRVIDHGRGIAPLQQARMIRSLAPLHAVSVQAQAGGFGLGLSFVRIVTERHHGRVEFSSTPGVGSEFRIILPAAPARIEQGSSEQAEL